MDFADVRTALRRARQARRLSLDRLEELSGITAGTIWKIEKGWIDPRTSKPYMPGAETLIKIIAALPNLGVGPFFAGIEGVDPGTRAADHRQRDQALLMLRNALDQLLNPTPEQAQPPPAGRKPAPKAEGRTTGERARRRSSEDDRTGT